MTPKIDSDDPVRAFLLRLLQDEAPTMSRPYLSFVDLGGIPVTTRTFDFLSDPSLLDLAYEFAALANVVPHWDAGHRWVKTENVLWDAYGRWLDLYVPAPLTLDKEQRKALAKARKYLERNFDVYWEYREKWNLADTLAIYWERMPEPDRPPDYDTLLRAAQEQRAYALEQWEIKADRQEFQTQYAIASDLSRRDPALAKVELRELMGPPMHSPRGEFYWTGLAPASAVLPGAAWPKFEITPAGAARRAQHPHAKSLAPDALTILSRNAVSGTRVHRDRVPAAGTRISFEMVRLGIQRGWISTMLLESRTWKWSDSTREDPFGGFPLSTGGTAPSGHLVMVPEEIILLRNREIEGPWVREWAAKRANCVDARLGVLGLGNPATDARGAALLRVQGDRLVSESMEIVGFLCQLMPMLPNPDWALWQRA